MTVNEILRYYGIDPIRRPTNALEATMNYISSFF
jgi:hypothetical protein